jgi:hypothetical protein
MEGARPSSAVPEARADRGRVPLWLKLGCTLFAVATFSAYLAYYSFAHSLLWFSSLGLLLTCVALWLESPLLASAQAVGVVLPELAYTADFLFRLTTGKFLIGLSVYIFEAQDSPLWVRSFSLFHIPLPFLLLWLLWRLGYDRRGWRVQTALAWVLLVCYFLTDPADNVNWVFGPKGAGWDWMPRWGWLVLLMGGFPLLIYLPSHWLFQKVLPAAPRRSRRE